MAHAALLRHVRPGGVHRMEGELPPDQAAARYETVLRGFADGGRPPRFDLLLLGIGPDGHVASLFPGIPELDEEERWVVATTSPNPGPRRITMTFPALVAADRILFLVAGDRKRDVVRRVLAGEPLPATRVNEGARDVRWLVDRAAAGA
jgi:6-phosphogluconolactonase